jgi:hypothetical protein
MRKIIILSLFLANQTTLLAQEYLSSLLERTEFCNSELSREQTAQLKDELNGLEDYFIKKGLLADKSGSIYYAVYKKIAAENDLNINIDSTFQLLNSLDYKVLISCFFKVLTKEELSELSLRHYEASVRISENYEGNITPSTVAQRILDNYTLDDFNLEFFRISSLVTFYQIASPTPILDLGLPDNRIYSEINFETIQIILDEQSRINIDNKIRSIEEAAGELNLFLLTDPKNKGIELIISNQAKYESYLKLMDVINSIYFKLNEEFGIISKNIIFKSID